VIDRRFKVRASGQPCRCTWVHPNNRLNITVANNNTFLAITDIHLSAGKTAAITYGQDTNDPLWDSTLAKISNLTTEQMPQFILLLGDLPAHRDKANHEKNIGTVLRSFSGLPAISQSQLPVFFVFGNNDSLTVNYGPFANDATNLFSLDPEHNSPEAKGWPALNANPDCSVSPRKACTYTTTASMPTEHAEDMLYAQTKGYYSAYPLGRAYPLRFIALNSIIFSHEYYQSGATQREQAQQQMDWLAQQLASAGANHEGVYIAMHIPIGKDAFNHGADMWNDTLLLNNGLKFRDSFLALMSQYKQNVRAVLTGHTHFNEYRALYADQSLTNLSVLGVGVPGITPNHYNNPGMQIYLYDPAYQLTEAKTFFTTPDISEWKSYSFQNDYACSKNSTMLNCVAQSLLPNLAKSNRADELLLQNQYQTNYALRAPNFDPSKGGYSDWFTILNAIQVVPSQ
nr:metallophosphoesterase [Pseudomonadota bacterium]